MRAEQCEASLLRVIEARGFPGNLRVTVCAFRATRTAMRIVGRVAIDANHRRAAIFAADVARIAAHFFMRIAQWEFRLYVIETRASPSDRRVAGLALNAELAAVQVIRAVAATAGFRRCAKRSTALVAAIAHDSTMGALERKIRLLVREGFAIELNDVALSALMLGMASLALCVRSVPHAAVQTRLVDDVRSRVVVAIEAKRRLAGAVSPVVAQ
jgi:hypothetical protein